MTKNSSMTNVVSESVNGSNGGGVININTQAAVLGVDQYLFLDSVNRPPSTGQSKGYATSAMLVRNSRSLTPVLGI